MENYTREDAVPSRWFKAADFKAPRTLTIEEVERVELKDASGQIKSKLAVKFVGERKGLVLNGVNYDTIADMCGDGTADWARKNIELYATTTRMGNKVVPCVRVRAGVKDSRDELSDEVPF